MKEKLKMTREKEFDQVGLLIQTILSVFLLFFTVLTIFESSFLILTQILVSFMMFVMAYNNHRTFKRRGLTYAYIIMGFLMVFLSIVLLIK
jgi:hypothetical protein